MAAKIISKVALFWLFNQLLIGILSNTKSKNISGIESWQFKLIFAQQLKGIAKSSDEVSHSIGGSIKLPLFFI